MEIYKNLKLKGGIFMSYVFDEDLEFLGKCSDEQLAKLAEIIINDDDGKFRRTEEVTEKRIQRKL